ncbi:MAG: DUF3794 domain-containing protein [Clostridia bacterium]|nr:DUF3794 domain-containing protein [Clostridia bacterium]
MNQNFDQPRRAGGALPIPLCDTAITMDVTKDYTRPDYQPEGRRIVHVEVTPLPPAKYVTERGAELNGNVDYTVLYVGMDGELYSAPLSAEYGGSVAFRPEIETDSSSELRLLCDVCCDTVSTRLTAPRRLTVKSRLRCRMLAYGEMEAADPVGEDSDSIRRLERKTTAVHATEGSGELITLEYNRPLPSENARVVAADAVAVCTERRCEEGRLQMKGNVEGRLLYALEEENGVRYETNDFSVPFEGEGEYDRPDGAGQESCRIRCQVSELSVDAAEGELQCRIGLSLGGQILSPLSVSYLEDLYSLDRMTTCDYGTVVFPTSGTCFSDHFTQSERPTLASLNFTEATELLAVFGRATVDEMTATETGCVLSGRSHYTVIGRTDGEIAASELVLPFRWEREEVGTDSFLCSADLLSVSARSDGESLMLDAEVYLNGILMGSGSVQTLRSASFGEALPREDCGMIVCYPVPGESLWSVAKRYAVDPAALSGDPERDRYVMIRR